MLLQQIELHGGSAPTAGYIAQIAKRWPLMPSKQNRFMATLEQARMSPLKVGPVNPMRSHCATMPLVRDRLSYHDVTTLIGKVFSATRL